MLSQGAANVMHLADLWEKFQSTPRLGGGGLGAAPVPVSHPYLKPTRFSGGVESETSTAWCGANAVITYNDDGSLVDSNGGNGFLTLLGIGTPTQGWPFDGYANSTNANTATPTFTDQGFPPIPTADTLNAGDPVAVCGSSSNFYLSDLFEDLSVPGPSGYGYTEVSIQNSTNGGASFGNPSPAVRYDAHYYLLDKDWMAINPANPSELAISYTNFNSGNFGPYSNDCGGAGADVPEVDIEAVVSMNGGGTWSSPTVVAYQCGGSAFPQGSAVAIDPSGNIFVAYENFASNFFTREIDIAESTNGGASFGTPVKVHSVNPVGDGNFAFGLQSYIRDLDFPSLAIGMPGAPNAGDLFLAWNDGNRRVNDEWMQFLQHDFGYGDGKYGFSNVLFTESTNHGATWSTSVRVNTVLKAPTDHYQPAVAAEPNGTLAACWYDRNVNYLNYNIARNCATSTNNGGTWSVSNIAHVGTPVPNQDLLIAPDYMGDYDGLATDYTGANNGFLGGFVQTVTGHQNVMATR